jgi:hypothetical protein
MQHSLPHSFTGNRAGIDTGAAYHFAPFDQGNPFAGLGPLDGGSLPGRPGTDDDQIVLLHSGLSARFILTDPVAPEY